MYVVAVTTKSPLCVQNDNPLPVGTTALLIAVDWWFDQGRFVLPKIMKKLPI